MVDERRPEPVQHVPEEIIAEIAKLSLYRAFHAPRSTVMGLRDVPDHVVDALFTHIFPDDLKSSSRLLQATKVEKAIIISAFYFAFHTGYGSAIRDMATGAENLHEKLSR